MISIRHHVITLVAVFVALAVGVVLGSGPLSDVADRGTSFTSSGDESGSATTDVQGVYAENFAAAVAPSVIGEKLAGQQVSVISGPGADEEIVAALTSQIGAASGSVAGQYALTDAMLDPSQKSLVDTLGSQLMTQNEDDVASGSTTYDRMGQLLGLATATTRESAANVTDKARSVGEAVKGADLMKPVAEATERAPVVLVVLGPDDHDSGVDAIWSGLLSGLASSAAGVVAVGTVADGGEGQIGRLRTDPATARVATIDGVDAEPGRIATVLTLAKVLSDPGGSFGASGSDGTAPLG